MHPSFIIALAAFLMCFLAENFKAPFYGLGCQSSGTHFHHRYSYLHLLYFVSYQKGPQMSDVKRWTNYYCCISVKKLNNILIVFLSFTISFLSLLQRDELKCPALPHACTCAQDSVGPPGPPGPSVKTITIPPSVLILGQGSLCFCLSSS